MNTRPPYEKQFFSALPTPAEMALWDASAIEDYRIPEFTLMENASREAFHVLRVLTDPGQRVLVLMGSGNNGGDGAALARHAAGGRTCQQPHASLFAAKQAGASGTGTAPSFERNTGRHRTAACAMALPARVDGAKQASPKKRSL